LKSGKLSKHESADLIGQNVADKFGM